MATPHQSPELKHAEAVIFDMDGLLLDTERLGLEHFRQTAHDFGRPELVGIFLQTIGRNYHDTREHFWRALGADFPFDTLRAHWLKSVEEHIEQFGVPYRPGLENLLACLDRCNLPRGVATSSFKKHAVQLLERVGLRSSFQLIVGGDEVSRGKPDPEIYLKAAAGLGITPSRCVVFEDSPAGLRAAHAAGMIPLLVPDMIQPSADVSALAFRVLDSLQDGIHLFEN